MIALRCLLLSLIVWVAFAAQTYKVKLTEREGSRIVELPTEQYVAAVLAGEAGILRSDEALKAMAVAARTFAANTRSRHASEGFDFCATTHCQRVDVQGVTARLRAAADETRDQVLLFGGKAAFTPYSRDCGGTTESAAAVWPELAGPYLRVHEDPYCKRHGQDAWSWSGPLEKIASALKAQGMGASAPITNLSVADRTSSGRVNRLRLRRSNGQNLISASTIRFAVGRTSCWNILRSDLYQVAVEQGVVFFRGSGEGHGVGLCQHGADEMGTEGRTYREILAFYYPGAVVSKWGNALQWRPMSGEGVVVFRADEALDNGLVNAVARSKRYAETALHMSYTKPIQVYVYPSLDAFRNATGEPGWVAGHTTGSRISLQPAALLVNRGALESTLRHEMLHVIMEANARPDLPLWFREGVVEYLSGDLEHADTSPAVPDTLLGQRESLEAARRGYRGARQRVASLINTYGRDTVLGWLKTGLPSGAH